MDAKQRHGLIGNQSPVVSPTNDNIGGNIRRYGMQYAAISRRGLRGNFVPPVRSQGGGSTSNMIGSRISGKSDDALEDSTRKWYTAAFLYIGWVHLEMDVIFNYGISIYSKFGIS